MNLTSLARLAVGAGDHRGGMVDAVRQWRAPVARTVRVTGSVSDANVTCGNGVIGSIRRGTQVLWEQQVTMQVSQ